MRTEPPEIAIAFATDIASQSPCEKSKRGAVLFVEDSIGPMIINGAHNSPPANLPCLGTEACKIVCAKRCGIGLFTLSRPCAPCRSCDVPAERAP